MIYVLIPGAGGDAWYWHLVERELGRRGHDAVSVELPTDVDSAGLAGYTDAVVDAFTAWPRVPIHVIAGRDDRFFPLEFQQRIARERLGLDLNVVPGGHLVALSHPVELVDLIESYQDT